MTEQKKTIEKYLCDYYGVSDTSTLTEEQVKRAVLLRLEMLADAESASSKKTLEEMREEVRRDGRRSN